MSAIVIRPAPNQGRCTGISHPDWMPLSVRLNLAKEINKAWAEFVTDMHDGPAGGPEVAAKFWKFITGT